MTTRRIPAAIGLVSLAVGMLAAVGEGAPLDATERSLVASVRQGVPSSLDLLERAVNVNSGTMNFEGVRATAALFRPELESLGFTARWVDGATWGRAGHLLAERKGEKGALRVLLIGHLDTVFEADSPFQRYEAGPDSTARGPGVSDMKGGDVVMLLALKALRDAGALDRFSVSVFLSGDEEKAGSPIELARRDLRAAARDAEVAIGFEDGDGDPTTAVIARRGASSWTLRTSGRPAHSSQIFREDVGDGAIFECARIVAAFRDSLSGIPYLTVSPGAIVGGTAVTFDTEAARGTAFGKSNVVPESTVVAGDLRTLSFEDRDRAIETMQRIVAAHLPGTGAELTVGHGYPPLAPTDGNRRLLARFDRASRDLGYGPVGPVDPARAGAADISFTADLVPMAIDGVGLMGSGGHTVEETGDLKTLPMQAERVAVFLWRLVRDPIRDEAGIQRRGG